MLFDSVHQALTYFRFNNPARPRYIDLMEQERGRAKIANQFSGDHPHDIWASICLGVEAVLKNYNQVYQDVFKTCELGEARVHPVDCSQQLKVPERTVYRALKIIRDDLEREFKRRELLKFDD